MKNRKIICLFLVVLVVLGSVFYFTRQSGDTSQKTITFNVVSLRDNVFESTEYKTSSEFLSEFLIENDLVVYEDTMYGMYIRAVSSIEDSVEDACWWAVLVNDEMAQTGASEIVLEDGFKYTLELMEGY